MTRNSCLLLSAGVVVGLIISGRFALRAQERAEPAQGAPRPAPRTEDVELRGPSLTRELPDERKGSPPVSKVAASAVPLQEALLRPYRFPFSRPTPLEQVCVHLKETLKGSVVLDLAALERKSVDPAAPVQLELDGVRLKTGLKLLLDQVGLTYHVVAEDNLMIITDHEGSEDPADRIWAELRALHRDLHAVQDAVDDLTDLMGVEAGEGPRVRKPTIIDEMPEHNKDGKGAGPDKPGRGGLNQDGSPAATGPRSRATPSRVPLNGPRRSL
jgi:hypothetical protein